MRAHVPSLLKDQEETEDDDSDLPGICSHSQVFNRFFRGRKEGVNFPLKGWKPVPPAEDLAREHLQRSLEEPSHLLLLLCLRLNHLQVLSGPQ